MPQAMIFDVDGTLIDSVDLHARAWHDVFAEFGFDIDAQRIRGQIGKGGDQLMPVFLSQQEIDEKGKAIDQRRSELYKERYLKDVTAFPEVRALFQELLSRGKRIALASSSKQDELEIYKRIANITDLVEANTTSDDAEQSKPHPDIFEAALQRLPGVAASDIMVVGDTPYDAEAAAKAGLRTVGLLCGGFPEADLRAAGCVAIYRDPADLLAHLDDPVLC